MDGTLIDSIGVWNRTDQRLIEEYAGVFVDLNDVQIMRDNFLHSNQDSDIYLAFCEYLINKYEFKNVTPKELLERRWKISGEVLERETDFKPNVVELVTRLKELGFVLVLATMTTQVQLDIYSKRNMKMLEKMNIAEVFDLITRKEDVKNKKPDPEIYNVNIYDKYADIDRDKINALTDYSIKEYKEFIALIDDLFMIKEKKY